MLEVTRKVAHDVHARELVVALRTFTSLGPLTFLPLGSLFIVGRASVVPDGEELPDGTGHTERRELLILHLSLC